MSPQPAAPAAHVQITVRPEKDGVHVGYKLREPISAFTFRNSAADIRTDTWRTSDGKLARTEITFPSPASVFAIEMTPDLEDRDRIYPALVRVGEGWVVYPRHLMPLNGALPFEIAYDLPAGWIVLGHRDRDGKLQPDGWKYIGPESQVERGTAIVATDPATPAGLRQEILRAANDSAALFAKRLGVSLDAPPTIIISYLPDDPSSGMRGDTTAGAVMSVRFHGSQWAGQDASASEYVHEFLAHEMFHFWNGGIADSAENATRPWLHEGGASYAAMLSVSRRPGRAIGDQSFLATLNGNFSACQSALADAETLLSANLNAGNAPYACGVVLQWAWDAGLRASSDSASDVLTLWRDMLADAALNENEYSVASAQRLTPPGAALGAEILLNASGDTRWSEFAAAMTQYGAHLSIGRDGKADRQQALMHLLEQHCNGQYGFYNRDDHLQLDTGDRCGLLSGNAEIDTIAGVPLFGDAEAVHDKVRELCATSGDIPFARLGETVGSAPCTKPLPQARQVWKVERAFAP